MSAKNLRLIDLETGEDLTQQYTLNNRNQAEAYRKTKAEEEAKKVGRKADFTFSAMKALHEITSVMTNAQLGYLFVLQGYVNYDGYLANKNKTVMSTADMITALSLDDNRSTFYNFLNKAIDHSVLIEREGVFYVNKRYHFRGKLGKTAAVKSYTTNVRRAFRDNIPEDLGLMYRLLPFVHLKTNILCRDPFESDPNKVKTLKAKEVAEILGITPSEFSRRYKRWKFADDYVMIMYRKGDLKGFILNPYIIRRDAQDPDDTLKMMFRAK